MMMTILQPLLLVFVLFTVVADSVAVPGGMRSKKTNFKRGPAMSLFMKKHERHRDTPTETKTTLLETSTSNAVTADAAATSQMTVEAEVTTKSFVRPAYFSMNRNNNDFNRDKSQHLILERRLEHELNKRKHHPPTLTDKKFADKNVALVETGSKMRLRGQTGFGPVLFVPGAKDAITSGLSAGYHG